MRIMCIRLFTVLLLSSHVIYNRIFHINVNSFSILIFSSFRSASLMGQKVDIRCVVSEILAVSTPQPCSKLRATIS